MLLTFIFVFWRFILAISVLLLRLIVISFFIVIIKLVCSLTVIRLLILALFATLSPVAVLLLIAFITLATV
jgi:hypothetical protein